ncbi:putative replication protein [Pseudomonas phage EL]|uniref:Putative replication protein n=1 Tax=Pseudomonas phage EL TaxID=273133 RepID=Q2Z156_9CAUD|nr:putative replication protein [Pseudomonas phage EL]CAG27119.1 putative replication protein [Pseudomonas phage EL]
MQIERIYTTPIEHPEEVGFYKHPTLPIWLSKDDDRILTETGFVEPSIGGEYKYYIRQHLHVLKLETFLEKPSSTIKLWGNHRDGDKRNNHLENLEWCTPSMNLIHAFKTGLRSDNLPGLLTDLETGEVKSFTSLRECATYLGINPGTLTVYMKSDRKYPLKFKYSVRLISEEPSKLTADDIGKVRKGGPKPCKIVNKLTGEIKHLAFEKSIQELFGLSERRYQRALKERGYEDWIFEEVKTYEEYVECLKDDKAKTVKSNRHLSLVKEKQLATAKKIVVTNNLTGEITEFDNLSDFSMENGFMISEINRALKTKDSWREFTFKYLE